MNEIFFLTELKIFIMLCGFILKKCFFYAIRYYETSFNFPWNKIDKFIVILWVFTNFPYKVSENYSIMTF